MHQFSMDGKYFLSVSNDNMLSLYDTGSNKLLNKYGDPRSANGNFTSLFYATAENALGKAFVGTSTGCILTISLDLSESTVFASNLFSSSLITDLCIDHLTNTLYCCSSKDSSVLKFNGDGSEIDQFDTNKPGVNCLALYATIEDVTILLTGGEDIRIFDAVSGALLSVFQGHSSDVARLSICSASISSSSLFVSFISSAEDKYINLWSYEKIFKSEKNKLNGHSSIPTIKKPNIVLRGSNTASILDSYFQSCEPHAKANGAVSNGSAKKRKRTNSNVLNGDQHGSHSVRSRLKSRILVTDSKGCCSAFEPDLNDSKFDSGKPIKLKSAFRIKDDKRFVSCHSVTDSLIVVASEPGEKSSNELVFNFVAVNGIDEQKENLSLSKKHIVSNLSNELPVENMVDGNAIEQTVESMELETLPVVTIVNPEEHSVVPSKPLEKKKSKGSDLASPAKKKKKVDDAAMRALTVGGVGTLLSQGLNSNNPKILKLCLEESNIVTISNTLKGLKGDGDYMDLRRKLVTWLVRTYISKPAKSAKCLRWIETSLDVYGAKMTNDREIMQTLARLYSTVNVRLRSNERLTRLGGKLNFVAKQIETKKQLEAAALREQERRRLEDLKSKPKVVYKE